MPVELLFDVRLALAEGPVWHDEHLWWVDILGQTFFRGDPAAGEWTAHAVPWMPGAAVPTRSGGWLLAAEHGVFRWGDLSAEPVLLDAPEPDRPHNRCNDGKVDPAGRFWIGTMDRKAAPGRGALYSLEPGANRLRRHLDGLTISNGLAWNPAKATAYFIDTPTQVVQAFRWDAANGTLSDPRVAVDLHGEPGSPDGMCIDDEGMLWVATWGGQTVLRLDPDRGIVLERHAVPATQVTSCCFGGPDRSTLYITSARVGLDAEALRSQPAAGSLFALQTNTTGPAPDLYAD